jgi:hypothetical protein
VKRFQFRAVGCEPFSDQEIYNCYCNSSAAVLALNADASSA